MIAAGVCLVDASGGGCVVTYVHLVVGLVALVLIVALGAIR